MPKRHVVIQRYSELTDAQDDQDHLESLGIAAETVEVADANSETGSIHELRVDLARAREAYEVLKEYYESEKDDQFIGVVDW